MQLHSILYFKKDSGAALLAVLLLSSLLSFVISINLRNSNLQILMGNNMVTQTLNQHKLEGSVRYLFKNMDKLITNRNHSANKICSNFDILEEVRSCWNFNNHFTYQEGRYLYLIDKIGSRSDLTVDKIYSVDFYRLTVKDYKSNTSSIVQAIVALPNHDKKMAKNAELIDRWRISYQLQ